MTSFHLLYPNEGGGAFPTTPKQVDTMQLLVIFQSKFTHKPYKRLLHQIAVYRLIDRGALLFHNLLKILHCNNCKIVHLGSWQLSRNLAETSLPYLICLSFGHIPLQIKHTVNKKRHGDTLNRIAKKTSCDQGRLNLRRFPPLFIDAMGIRTVRRAWNQFYL